MMDQVKIINKPWGSETIFAHTGKYVGKIINIKAGHRLSFQYHRIKDETLYIFSGLGTMIKDNENISLVNGLTIRIKPYSKHRIEAIEDMIIIEVSTPEFFDIIRLEDDYGRKINEY